MTIIDALPERGGVTVAGNAGRTRKVRYPSARTAEATFLGYRDALDGLDFHPNYDVWSEGQQRNYETARLHVANIRAAGLRVPGWSGPDVKPVAFIAAMRRSVDLVGASTPPAAARPRP